MKRGHKSAIAVTVSLIIWLVIALIYFMWHDDSGWRDGQWYWEYMMFAQLVFAILTPVFLMAIAIGVLRDEKPETREESANEYYDLRPATRSRHQPPAETRTETRAQTRAAPRQQRTETRYVQPEPRPRPRAASRPTYEHIPEYEPSIYEDEVQCPTCRRWISTDMPRCAFCRTKVSNFNRVRQVQKQYRSGQINKVQFDRAMKNLKG